MPSCPPAREQAHGRERRPPALGRIATLYLAVLASVVVDQCLFRVLPVWLVVLVEVLEAAPVGVGIWLFARAPGGGLLGVAWPRVVVVPLMAVAIQGQLLVVAEIYRHVALT